MIYVNISHSIGKIFSLPEILKIPEIRSILTGACGHRSKFIEKSLFVFLMVLYNVTVSVFYEKFLLFLLGRFKVARASKKA